jgi:uncharacterized membrane protein
VSLRALPHWLAVVATVLWVGGMWVVGYLAVPALFQSLPDRQLAGMLAGKMFSWMAFVGMVCGVYLLLYQAHPVRRAEAKRKLVIVALMLLLLGIGQFLIQPVMADLKLQALPAEVMQSPFAGQFRMLHGTASILYLLQSLLGVALLVVSFPKRYN